MPPRILTLDAALATASAGFVADDIERHAAYDAEGHATALPRLAQAALAAAANRIDLIAVTVGPGSFTGLRAALALAHGIAIGLGIPVIGVTIGTALAALAQTKRELWTAIDDKRGHLYLERPQGLAIVTLQTIPHPTTATAIAGDAAPEVAAHLASNGFDVQLLDLQTPTPLAIARAAAAGPTRPPLPLYIAPPQATPGPPSRPPPR